MQTFLSQEQLQHIHERNPGNPDIHHLLDEIKKYQLVMQEAYETWLRQLTNERQSGYFKNAIGITRHAA